MYRNTLGFIFTCSRQTTNANRTRCEAETEDQRRSMTEGGKYGFVFPAVSFGKGRVFVGAKKAADK